MRIALGLGIALVIAGGFAIAHFVADDRLDTIGPSMKPTLENRIALEIDADAYEVASPMVDDIVAAQAPLGVGTEACGAPTLPGSPCARPEHGYRLERVVKRVVALPGDRVAFAPDGHVIRNGVRAGEPFIRPCSAGCGLPDAVTVPPDHYFLAGDNRPVSSDSRVWGPVPESAIDGRVILSGEAG